MASISFYLDRVSKYNPKSEEIRSVNYYATWRGKRLRRFTSEKIRECDWVPQIQRVNPKITGAGEVNKRIQSTEDQFTELFKIPSFNPTPEELELKLQKKDFSFFGLFEDYLKDAETRISEPKNVILSINTTRNYRSAMEFYKRFEEEKKYKIEFSKIGADFYSKIREFCLIDNKYSVDTFSNKIKKLKTFLYWCQERDVPVSNKFHTFASPQNYEEVEFIPEDRVLELWGMNLGSQDQKFLDVFLALCSTGMRISDYNRVMVNMDKYLVKTDQGNALVFNAQKTGAKCIVPFQDDLYFRVEYLYKKYAGKMPYMPGQKLNYWLKESALIENGETRRGRKTFCSIKYFVLGIEAQYVMKMSGHQTESEFKKYVGAKADIIVKASNEKSQYLKVV